MLGGGAARPQERARVLEIDCLRGAAVCLMLVSNFLFDLYYFYDFGDPQAGFLAYFSRMVAGLFLFIVGVSLTLSVRRKHRPAFTKCLLRSLKILCVAMVITVATFFVVGKAYVVFGILHLISFSVVAGYFFLEHPWLSLVVGLMVMILGPSVGEIQLGSVWLLWLGVHPPEFSSVDYTPVFPWFGLVLIGIFAGTLCYGKREVGFLDWGKRQSLVVRALAGLGRKSLLVYCLHQPVFWSGFLLIAWLFPC